MKNSDVLCETYALYDCTQHFSINENKGYTLDLLFCDLEEVKVCINLDSIIQPDKHHLSLEIKFYCNQDSNNNFLHNQYTELPANHYTDCYWAK